MTKKNTPIVLLIKKICRLIIPNFSATYLPLCTQIKHLKQCLENRFHEDCEISLDQCVDFLRFAKSEASDRLLRHILKNHCSAMRKKQLKKIEDYNLMLKARVEEQKQELKKAEDDKLVLVAQSEKCSKELLHVQDRNGELWSTLEEMEKSKSIMGNRVKAYGEGFPLNQVTDERLESIGMMIGVAEERWKREHVKREVDKKLSANPHFLCPITTEILVCPVVGSDGHTYERYALENWINLYRGKSPITRQPISILRDDDALKHCIDSTRASLEREISEKCELPKL